MKRLLCLIWRHRWLDIRIACPEGVCITRDGTHPAVICTRCRRVVDTLLGEDPRWATDRPADIEWESLS